MLSYTPQIEQIKAWHTCVIVRLRQLGIVLQLNSSRLPLFLLPFISQVGWDFLSPVSFIQESLRFYSIRQLYVDIRQLDRQENGGVGPGASAHSKEGEQIIHVSLSTEGCKKAATMCQTTWLREGSFAGLWQRAGHQSFLIKEMLLGRAPLCSVAWKGKLQIFVAHWSQFPWLLAIIQPYSSCCTVSISSLSPFYSSFSAR